MTIPGVQPLLKHYIQQRWCCSSDGYFETGDLIFRHSANCPDCGMPAASEGSVCDGRTTRALPFVTRPHMLDTDNHVNFQVNHSTGITTRPKSNRASVRRGGRRATGRPRKKLRPEMRTTPIQQLIQKTGRTKPMANTLSADQKAAIAAAPASTTNRELAAKYGVSEGAIRWHRTQAKKAAPAIAPKPAEEPTRSVLQIEVDHAFADSVWAGFSLEEKLAVVSGAIQTAVRQHFSAR